LHAGKHALNKLPLLLLLVASAPLLLAQHGGFLSGQVRDRSGLPVPGAEVHIQSESTGARQQTTCDGQGRYVSSELAAGDYKVTVRSKSFRTASRTGIAVRSGQTQVADFVIELLPLTQEVTVQSTRDDSDPTANGLAVTRESSLTTLPMNGRDLHALYSLVPGAAVTPAASSDGGQFTVAGQRPNTNTFRIDGVSGNTGLGLSAVPGTFTGATLPGMTVIGSTQSLVSKEEIQRVDMRSSDFAPEYASRPGASVLVETRSGSDDFHGSAFAYARPRSLDSRDWFAQKYDPALAPASLNGYGASVGGALWPGHTFFFAAFEHENVNDSAMQIMPSPSVGARQSAPANYAPLLNVFPLPLGPVINPNEGIAAVPLRKQATVADYSIRLDQALSDKAHAFARFSDVPSSSTTFQLDTTDAQFAWKSATAGVTLEWAGLIHDLRFNYSFVHATSSWPATTEAQASAISALSSGGYYVPGNYVTAMSIAGVGQVISGYGDNSLQRQYEGTYNVTKQLRTHDLRAGLDFVELLPRTLDEASGIPTLSVIGQNVAAMVAGNPLDLTFSGGKQAGVSGHIPIGSVFLQDTYKISADLTLLYGLRWEITHPSDSAYSTGFSVGQWNGPGTTPSNVLSIEHINNHINWPMRYSQIAPRFGLAYHWNRPRIVLRAGAGLFYDDALGSLIDPVNLSPLSWSFMPGALGTTSVSEGSEVVPLAPTLFLPQVWEWRVSAEKAVGSKSTASLSYAGSAARKLLREQTLLAPDTQILQGFAFSSTGSSDFEALEAQFRGQLTSGLAVLAGYTWGHSIDTGSQDSAIFWTGPGYSDAANRGSSSFDLRHNLTASATYVLPDSRKDLSRLWSGWNLSSTLIAHTGFPFDVTTVDRSIGLGFANTARPNLVYGVPLWIPNSAMPGGRELNPAAFQMPSGQGNGTLGRNVLTGFGTFQIDASVRREFRLFGSSVLEVNASAYNVFNHASFSNPVGYLGSALFGRSVSMQSLMLGSGGPNNGLTPIFQQGGPRTVEMGIRFTF
jgi:hypothetical protein